MSLSFLHVQVPADVSDMSHDAPPSLSRRLQTVTAPQHTKDHPAVYVGMTISNKQYAYGMYHTDMCTPPNSWIQSKPFTSYRISSYLCL